MQLWHDLIRTNPSRSLNKFNSFTHNVTAFVLDINVPTIRNGRENNIHQFVYIILFIYIHYFVQECAEATISDGLLIKLRSRSPLFRSCHGKAKTTEYIR